MSIASGSSVAHAGGWAVILVSPTVCSSSPLSVCTGVTDKLLQYLAPFLAYVMYSTPAGSPAAIATSMRAIAAGSVSAPCARSQNKSTPSSPPQKINARLESAR